MKRCAATSWLTSPTASCWRKGSAAEIIAGQHLTTWAIHGDHLIGVAGTAAQEPGVDADGDLRRRVCTSAEPMPRRWSAASQATRSQAALRAEKIETSLEDVFIYMMSRDGPTTRRPGMNGSSFSIARWWASCSRSSLQLRRDRVTFAMIVGIPIMQMALFGYAINTDPKHLDTAIISADDSDITRSFICGDEELVVLQDSSASCPTKQRDARRWRGARSVRGEYSGGIHAPASAPRAAVVADRSRRHRSHADGKRARCRERHCAVGDPERADWAAGLARRSPAPFDVDVHRLYNPDDITQYNVVPGLMGVVLTLTMVMMTGLAITRERERGTMENLLAMPATPMEVMTGKLIPYIGIGLIQSTIILLAARLCVSRAVLRQHRRRLSCRRCCSLRRI